MAPDMHHCFPPVIRPDTRLLVLGSLPGALSLARGRYYAHPQNLFWRLIGAVIGRDLAALDYEARLEALLDAHVGLWDTVAAATRRGSLDADIRLHEASDLAALAATLPELRAIGFNGATSARIGRRQLAGLSGPALVDLPSSSPAYASMSFDLKRAAWLGLAAYL
jgi:hypoxanthine-DNA glycosylase